ncbi:hypothetical protein [Saccharolobus shibatae]|uniref:CRISPR-associated RAMP Cmr3 n=1 Tax=Saccharolobus shibatae TaxID=2286 RepID=A0A8F5BV52_9CREN|nr:hypothetical protein [Saccharolobus shibatae]QXJ31899.1 CRISPR-associated RAMP Cmr3 [Saccharolobus shibatae]QXJ34905.1 CRISPR-associated RAMP Cmr3 [Saccharolobus shibatae]
MKLILKPLEEYRIGLRQSNGIVIENVDVVSAFPSPTTVLGIIGKLNNAIPSNNSSEIEDLIHAYKSLTSNELNPYSHKSNNPLIWGPMIYKGNDTSPYYPLLFSKLILNIEKYVKLAINPNISREDVVEELHVQTRRMNQINRSNRYTIHSFYQKFFSHEYTLEYCVNTNVKSGRIVELGGENRYGEVEIRDSECDYREGNYAVLLQPLLFETSKDYFTKIDNVKGLECVEEIYGILVEKGNRIDFKVKVIYYALGYGKVRRPMLQALPPGTVIKVKNECKEANTLGILSELGFGAIYKVKL